MRSCKFNWTFGAVWLVSVVLGCGGSQSKSITGPSVDPADITEAALEAYDANSDDALSEAELESVPAIGYLLGAYDTNSDGSVSKEELENHFTAIFQAGPTMSSFSCTILMDNRPLEGAEVVFEPEAFMGDGFATGRGTTGPDGQARIIVADEDLPERNQGIGAIYDGVYKMTVSHPSVQIPAAYQGSTSILGCEVSGYTIQGTGPRFALDKKGSKPKNVHPQ